MNKTKFQGVYQEKSNGKITLFTKNLVPGIKVYGENIVYVNGVEYRHWEPTRSKLAAAILKGIKEIGIAPNSRVLYLGAASGTTASHISDIVGNEGFVYALDFAYRVMRDLYFVTLQRKNMAPLFYDAAFPELYSHIVDKVDVIYMDIAQKNQLDIFLNNVTIYLKKGGLGLFFVKARSIDVVKNPKQIYADIKKELEKSVKIIDFKELDPYEKDHCVFVIKK